MRMTLSPDDIFCRDVNESYLVREVLRASFPIDVILNIRTIPLDIKFLMGYEGTRYFIRLKTQDFQII